MKKEQKKYDFETEHSRDSIEQVRWNNIIDSTLIILDAYKDTLVIHYN